MIARDLPARTPDEVARLVRALGSHRYVAGRLILVHAFVFEAIAGARDIEDAREAVSWAHAVLASDVDVASRDDRLWRRATERELGVALRVVWNDDEDAVRAREVLAARLHAIDAPIASVLFDESSEDEVFPALVDAGWELLPLAALDAEKHRGAIAAFGDADVFERAKFDEESAVDATPPLHELPVLGPAELLHGAEHAILKAPFVLWVSADDPYQDYVLRGVLRAAKLE